MPSLPTYTKCQHLGCKNEKSRLNQFCLEHGGRDVQQTNNEDRKEYNSIYRTPFWRTQRQRQLSTQPMCQACLVTGVVTPAEHVDHVFAWNKIGKDAFYTNLFQSLCQSCHSHKTSLEQQGIFRHYQLGGAVDYKIGDYASKCR
jgi:5-methylcytosine-specific restriction endonuclease McrA